ncbi:MAG: DnaJ family molecular chaperone [Pseudomonadota bacterium]
MSIWSDIGDIISSVATQAFESVMEGVRTAFSGNPETRKKVGFSVAIIALSAKMAKADGVVTEDEISAFRDVFAVPPDELDNVARLYNLAKQDVAGFDAYAQRVRDLFPGDEDGDREILRDVIDALFHIAKADGLIHENELLFLEEISSVFGFDEADFAAIQSRHIHGEEDDPYEVLGAQPNWDFETIKKQYRKRASESHPDRMIARGVPSEFIALATERLAQVNAAWETIQRLHALGGRSQPRLVNSDA